MKFQFHKRDAEDLCIIIQAYIDVDYSLRCCVVITSEEPVSEIPLFEQSKPQYRQEGPPSISQTPDKIDEFKV